MNIIMSQLTLSDIITNLNIITDEDLSITSSTSTSSSTTNKINEYMDIINTFYNKLTDDMIYKIIDIINRKSKISLRLIEWFVSKYTQNHIIEIYDINGLPMNIYNSYHIKTKIYEKKYFDLFRRVNVIQYKFKNKDDMIIDTTISQLNFFKWLIENNIYYYIENNIDELIEIMSYNNALERDNRKRKTLLHKKHHHK